MSFLVRNLSKCLEPNSDGPPADVTFKFKEAKESVKAHKLILAISSEVFNREFYGSLKVEDEIEIVDANKDVFQAMVDFIYNKAHINWKECAPTFLCSLYYLAEKYNLTDLKQLIVDSIADQKVTKENALDVARIAEDNNHHQPLCEALYEVVAYSLNREFGSRLQSAIDFFNEHGIDENIALVMMKLMVRLRMMYKTNICENCKQSPCLHGKGLTINNFIHTPLRSQERPLSFLKGHGGDRILPGIL